MRDPRVENLARILVNYSVKLKEGDTCAIRGPSAGEPLIAAVYEQALQAGANPTVALSFEGQSVSYFSHASDAQLEWVSPIARWEAEECDANIVIGADTNTRELSQVPPERQAKRRAATRALMETTMRRSAEGSFRWVYTLFPTSAYASDAEMSLGAFEDFYYGACFADADDPVAAWRKAAEEWKRLADWIEGHEEVRVTAPGTDIKLGITGRKFIAADGEHNMPDGEFFTAPVEDSVEGEVSFHLPAMVGGREVVGAHLKFDGGKVVDATAERGEDFLVSLLDTDEGSRRLGELGIGTNFGIDRGTRDVLLDEKIGGTVHMAVGASYPECGGSNESAVHTDLVCDLRGGGRIEVDGELFQEDGRFVV
jgi:aminopeptidase